MNIDLFVNGTLMRGLGLHANLAGAEFLEACQTAPRYRLYSIGDVHPGMFEVGEGGVAVAGELYRVPDDVLVRVEAGEPPGLYRGPVHLADGRVVPGILFPRQLAEGLQRDISAYGGWRAYVERGKLDAATRVVRERDVPSPGDVVACTMSPSSAEGPPGPAPPHSPRGPACRPS